MFTIYFVFLPKCILYAHKKSTLHSHHQEVSSSKNWIEKLQNEECNQISVASLCTLVDRHSSLKKALAFGKLQFELLMQNISREKTLKISEKN